MRKIKPLAGKTPAATKSSDVLLPERRLVTEGLRSFFASRNVGYLCLDADGLVTMANPTLLRWLGHGYESVIGRRHFGDLLAAPSRAAFNQAFTALHRQGWLRCFRGDLDGRAGSRPIQVHLTAVQAQGGQFLRYDGVVLDNSAQVAAEQILFVDGPSRQALPPTTPERRDATNAALRSERDQRTRAEAALGTSEERYQSVVAALAEGVILQRNDGVVLSWNPAAERILGLSAEDAIGAVVLDDRWRAIRQDHTPFPEAQCPFRPTGRLRESCRDVIMGLKRPDGSHCWISLNTAPLFRPGEDEPYGVVASFSDITASRKMLQQQTFTQYAVDHANEAIARVGEDGRIRYVNDAGCRLLGYSRVELLALAVWDLDIHIPAAEWPRHWQRLLQQGACIQETSVRARDGREIPVELAITVMAPFGRAFHFVTLRDLSERKRAEAALEESEARYRSVVTTIHEGIVLQQADSTFIACNPSAERILGISQDALLGTNCSQLQALRENGADYPEADRPSQVVLSTGQPCTGVSMGIRRPDGSVVWVAVNSMPLFRPGESQPCGVVSSFADITARRRMEKRLRFTQYAVDHAAEGIAWIREDGSFMYVNDEACRMLGHTRAEMQSLKAYDIDAFLTESSWPVHWQQLHPGGTFVLDTVHCAKDGRRIPVELAISVEEMEGRQYHCVFIRDLTERLRTTAALRESEARLRESARQLSLVEEQAQRKLAAELHDAVGSSLGALGLYLKELDDALPSHLPPRLAHTLASARSVLGDVVAQLRAITSGLRPTLLDYAGLPDALADYARQFQANSGIRVNLCVEGSSPWHGAPETDIALFRITQEALHNCAKHSQAHQVTVQLQTDALHAALTISDDGVGFTPACPVDEGKPCGMGLLSMRERAVAIGWQFELESTEGAGTRIRVSRACPSTDKGCATR